MPKPLPSGEIEISRRLRKWRFSTGKTRSAIAREIGEKEQRLESYESGRVPLRWLVFQKLRRKFGLNPFWLATGSGPETAQDLIPEALDDIDSNEPERATFSAIFAKYFRAIAVIEGFVGRRPLPIRARLFVAFNEALQLGLDPDTASEEQLSQRRKMLAEFSALLDEAEKEGLVMSSETVPIACVPPHTSRLDGLLIRARAATAARGSQAELARFLDTQRQHVHRWLSGSQEPGGETTLRLLEWVTATEANQTKTPAVSLPQPAQKPKPKQTRERKQSKGRRRR